MLLILVLLLLYHVIFFYTNIHCVSVCVRERDPALVAGSRNLKKHRICPGAHRRVVTAVIRNLYFV